jgi:hypothetical protein
MRKVVVVDTMVQRVFDELSLIVDRALAMGILEEDTVQRRLKLAKSLTRKIAGRILDIAADHTLVAPDFDRRLTLSLPLPQSLRRFWTRRDRRTTTTIMFCNCCASCTVPIVVMVIVNMGG